jgi:hypothetical protein
MANAKRGFVPEDRRNFSKSALPVLQAASSDVCHLLDRGYGLSPTLTFVANHYQLSVRQRLAIMRSVCSTKQREQRKRKIVDPAALKGQTVWIDGFNQIITLEVMACRSPLFLGMDGVVRDLAALRGTYRLISETDWALRTLLRFLKSVDVGAAVILLDAPVSNSGRLRQAIFKANAAFGLDLAVPLIRGVDAELSGHNAVMTADSAVLDRCAGWINFTGSLAQQQHYPMIQVWQ